MQQRQHRRDVGRRHQLVLCGAVRAGVAPSFPEQLSLIYRELSALIASQRPDCVVIESIFHAVNARSALKLGHARGVAMLAATEAGVRRSLAGKSMLHFATHGIVQKEERLSS